MKPGSFLTDGEISGVSSAPAIIMDDEALKKKGIIQLMDLAHCALVLYNPKGKLVFANRRAYEVWGSTEEEWKQQVLPKFSEFIHPEDLIVFSSKRLEAMKKITRASMEVRMIRGPCTHMWTDFRPLVEKSANALCLLKLGFVSCGIDITEQKKKEQESIDALKGLAEVSRLRAEDAEEARRLQEVFIDSVCHEIRNPLNGILHCNNFINSSLVDIKKTLDTLKLDDKADAVVKTIRQDLDRTVEECKSILLCATHQRSIADDVLNLSKLSTMKIRLDLKPFTPRDLITQVIESFRAQMLASCITHQLEFKGLLQTSPTQALIGDPVKITQIIINIFMNAIKFVQHTSVKEIRAVAFLLENSEYTPKVAFKVTIEDSGIGMTEEEKASLFQKFQQASLKTYSKYGGSGLGLFISKSLVMEMGGRIEVESEKGVGTRFTVIIPLEKSETAPTNLESSTTSLNILVERPIETRSSNIILVVDDNDINRKILTTLIKRTGYQTIEAENGQTAVELATTNNIALIFMDIEMPIMNGKEATTKIREWEGKSGISDTVPIIAVTGNARSEQIKGYLDLGMQAVIVKPFQPAEIQKSIKKWIDSHQKII
ncbi:UNVERIFIED_CONTAM: hypothetical protein HDU68_001427 [Siphonaria sp. JEL0065]|nr:hypothetical protein HDU68_001427 [Siphonaria sp. JEL0065]